MVLELTSIFSCHTFYERLYLSKLTKTIWTCILPRGIFVITSVVLKNEHEWHRWKLKILLWWVFLEAYLNLCLVCKIPLLWCWLNVSFKKSPNSPIQSMSVLTYDLILCIFVLEYELKVIECKIYLILYCLFSCFYTRTKLLLHAFFFIVAR